MTDLRELLKEIRQWDALDIPDTDGEYWKKRIDDALRPDKCPTCGSDCNERDELHKAEREIERLSALLKQYEQNPPTNSYVQVVPDKCDRIVWRGHYFHLPISSTSKPEQAEPPTGPGADRYLYEAGFHAGERAPVTHSCRFQHTRRAPA